MQLEAPTMVEGVARAASVAKGKALWHAEVSGGHCLGLASVQRVSGKAGATKLIVFPDWDNLVQCRFFGGVPDLCAVSIN